MTYRISLYRKTVQRAWFLREKKKYDLEIERTIETIAASYDKKYNK